MEEGARVGLVVVVVVVVVVMVARRLKREDSNWGRLETLDLESLRLLVLTDVSDLVFSRDEE